MLSEKILSTLHNIRCTEINHGEIVFRNQAYSNTSGELLLVMLLLLLLPSHISEYCR